MGVQPREGQKVMADKNVAPAAKSVVERRPSLLFDPLRGFPRRFDSLFDELWGGRRPSLAQDNGFLAPNVEISESDDELQFVVELPGIDKDDVDVSITDDVLVICGEKKQEEEKEERDYHLSERIYGSFRRSFALPQNANADKADAKTVNGVLTIKIPKVAAAKPAQKKIKIKAS